MSNDDSIEELDEQQNLSSPSVIDKYNSAAKIANNVLIHTIESLAPGQNIFDICQQADNNIENLVKEVHAKIKFKGIAFPTCLSVNNCGGNFAPLTLNDNYVLQQGDVVKIDLGVQFDGYASTVGHTTVVGASSLESPITGRTADVICAAYFASECVLRSLRPGKTNTEVTNIIQKVAQVFHVTPVQGVLSHEILRNRIDGKKVIINKYEVDKQVDEFQFEAYQAFAIDIVMSTGEGKTRQVDTKNSVFKRNPNVSYTLKMKSSRNLFNQIKERFGNFPFNLRSFEDARARLGITELVSHELVNVYPTLWERNGEIVAQFKFTALILPGATKKLNDGFPLPWVSSEFKVEDDPELAQIMSTDVTSKKKNKKKKEKSIQ